MITNNKCLSITMFIAVFFSSMLGAQLFGISLNKLALIPLLIFLLFNFRQLKLYKATIPLLIFFVISIFSSIIALTADYANNYSTYKKELIMNAIQVLIFYIPLVILLSKYKDKKMVSFSLKKSILITCKIHVVWGLMQFILYTFLHIDINGMFLNIFYGKATEIAMTNLGSIGIFIRPTGLTNDPAFFGLVLVLAILFEKKKYSKLFIFLMACIAMSRVAIVVIIFIYLMRIVTGERKLIINKGTAIIFASVTISIIVLLCIPVTRNHAVGLLSRFANIASASKIDGTSRHVLYIPNTFRILFEKFDLLEFFIGAGPRQSGTIIYNSFIMDDYLVEGMRTNTWVAETDVAELLLGYGIIGTSLYLISLFSLYNKFENSKGFIFGMLLFGIMYNVSGSTLFLIVLISITSIVSTHSEKEQLVKGGTENERNNISRGKWNKTLSTNTSN